MEPRHMLSGTNDNYSYTISILDSNAQQSSFYTKLAYTDNQTLQAPWVAEDTIYRTQGSATEPLWTSHPTNTGSGSSVGNDSVGFAAAPSEHLIDTPKKFREHLLAGTVAEVSDDLIGCLNNGATLGLGGQNALYGTEIMQAWGMTSGSLYELLVLNSRYPSQLQQPDAPVPSVFVRDEVIQAMQRIVGFPFSGPSNALQPNAWAPRLSVFSKTDLGNGGFITVNPPDQTVKNLDIHVPTNQSLFDFTNQNREDLLRSSNPALPEQVFTYLENWYKTAVTNGTNPIDVFSEISGIPNLTNRIENPPTQTLIGVPQPASTDAGDPPVYDAYYNPQLNTTANYVVYQDACTAVGGYFANSLIKNQSAINSFFGLFANQRIEDRANALSTGDTVTAEQKTKELAIGLRALMALTYDASPLWSSYGIGYSNAANPMVGSLHSTGMPPTDFIDQFAGQEIQLTNIFPPSTTLQIMTSDAEPDPFNDPHPIPTNYLSDGWFTLGPDQQLSGIQYYKNVNSASFTDSYVINPGSAVYLNPISTSSDTLRVDEVPGTTFLPLTRSTIIDVDGTSTELRHLHPVLGHPDVLPAEFATYISLAGGVDRVTGGSLNDVIIGTSKSDNVPVPGRLVVSAGAGQDVVSPGRGGSLVELGPGNDTVIFGIDDLFGETNFLDFVHGEDRIVLDGRIKWHITNYETNADTIRLSYKHAEKTLRNSVGSWNAFDISTIDMDFATGLTPTKSTSNVSLDYLEFHQFLETSKTPLAQKILRIEASQKALPYMFVVNIGDGCGNSFTNPYKQVSGTSYIDVPLKDFAEQIQSIRGTQGKAVQISITPWTPFTSNASITDQHFGDSQIQVFVTTKIDTTPGTHTISSAEVETELQTGWKVIRENTSTFKLAYVGGLANYLIENGLTSADKTAGHTNNNFQDGVDTNNSIVIDLGMENQGGVYSVGVGKNTFNLSSRVAIFDGKPYHDKATAEQAIQNLVSIPTGNGSIQYLPNLVMPHDLVTDGKAPNFYSVSTDHQVIVRGHGVIDGFTPNHSFSNITMDGNAPHNKLLSAHYFISTDLLAISSTYEVTPANQGNVFAIDVSGITVKWPSKRGYGPTLLQDLNTMPGTAVNTSSSPEGPSSGTIALRNEDNTIVLDTTLESGERPFTTYDRSPVKVYDYKQVGGWVDAADGPSLYGKNSYLGNSFIHANDDSIKAQAPNFTAENNTLFQGAAGNPIGVAYGFWNGSVDGSRISNTFIHRISHNYNSCNGNDNPYGLVAMRAIPSNRYATDHSFGPFTVDGLYVPDMGIQSKSSTDPTNYSKINSVWYISSLDIQGQARRGSGGFFPPSNPNINTKITFSVGGISVTGFTSSSYPNYALHVDSKTNKQQPSWVQIGHPYTIHNAPDTYPAVPKAQGYDPTNVLVTKAGTGQNFKLWSTNENNVPYVISDSNVLVKRTAPISILPTGILPTISRPQLHRSSKILVHRTDELEGKMGPSPVVLAYSTLADATRQGTRDSATSNTFVVSEVASGYVEKKRSDGSWVDVSTPPKTSNPRALLQLLRNRMITPSDEIRWVPGTANEGNASAEAFSLYGWDGVSASVEASEIEVGVE